MGQTEYLHIGSRRLKLSYVINHEIIPLSVNVKHILDGGEPYLSLAFMNCITGERYLTTAKLDYLEEAEMLMLDNLMDSIVGRGKKCLLINYSRSEFERVSKFLPIIRAAIGGGNLTIESLIDLQTFKEQQLNETSLLFYPADVVTHICEMNNEHVAGRLCMFDCLRFSEMLDFAPEWASAIFQRIINEMEQLNVA